jgi:poly-beta-1,6-N-acetyl-D-glucosamine synthesis protein
MDQSRSRVSQITRNKQFIVESKRHVLRDLIVVFFSLLVWSYTFVVTYFFVDAILGLNHPIPTILKSWFKMTNQDVIMFLGFVVLSFVIIFILLWTWSQYNRLRYGHLRRRKYPEPSQSIDFIKLGLIDYEIYEKLQNAKEIILEKNPMK